MAIKLVLSSKDIVEKIFPQAPRGYDAFEVDLFLDKILKDYKLVEENVLVLNEDIESLNNKIAELEKQNKELALQNASYQNTLNNINENDVVTTDNINLIKRINALEKFLWNNGYNPTIIK